MLKLRELNLIDVDGFFDFVNIYNNKLKKELLKHDLIIVHSYTKCSASEKLKNENLTYNDIFKLLTNKTFKQLEIYEERVFKINKLKTLFELAKEFKYKLTKE